MISATRIIAISAILSVAAFSAAGRRPVRNSFIDYRINSVGSLIHEVDRDPAVADRYMRHFGMTRPEVVKYLRTLHPDVLRKDGTFTVYSIPEDGHVKMHVQKLHKGEKIFADKGGTPVLVMRCGNPLTLGPSSVLAPNSPNEVEAEAQMPSLDAMRNQPELDAGTYLDTTEVAMITPSVPDLLQADTAPDLTPGPEITPPSTERAGVFTGGVNNSLSMLAVLPILGGLAWSIGSQGGDNVQSVVPEPAPYVVFAVGGLGLVFGARRRSCK